MLKELFEALIRDASLRDEFGKNAAAVLARYKIPEAQRRMIRRGEKDKLAKIVGPEVMEAHDAAMKDVIVRPFYPGAATFTVNNVTVTPSASAPLLCTVDVAFGWQEPNVIPQKGLPSYGTLAVYDGNNQLVNGINRTSTYVVPLVMDLTKAVGEASIQILFPGPGFYTVVVDAPGSPEVLPSPPSQPFQVVGG